LYKILLNTGKLFQHWGSCHVGISCLAIITKTRDNDVEKGVEELEPIYMLGR
jgi:hypothetical protein